MTAKLDHRDGPQPSGSHPASSATNPRSCDHHAASHATGPVPWHGSTSTRTGPSSAMPPNRPIPSLSCAYDEPVENLGAPIVSFEDFDANRPAGRIVATSGGFDPIHPGHISSLQASGEFGDVVVAIVNGDAFLRAKKGRPFQDLRTRCLIVSAVRGVGYVVPFEIDGDLTVCEALRQLRPDIFTKGGDRTDADTIAEWDVCQELGIEVVTGVGADKQWSSSWFLDAWAQADR